MNKRQALIAISILGLGFAGGYCVGRHPRNLATLISDAKHGAWVAHFKMPGSFGLPEKAPVIKCSFRPDDQIMALAGMFQATMTNLTDRRYIVQYQIVGYDAQERRVSEGGDGFTIGGHETVMRQLNLDSQVVSYRSVAVRYGTTFSIQMSVQDTD